MPTIELGVNEVWRQGREVVGRHDIIPVATEGNNIFFSNNFSLILICQQLEWIRLENVEFHNCVQLDEYEKTRTIRFKVSSFLNHFKQIIESSVNLAS